MAKFYYICRDKNGNKKAGVEEALSQDEAINKLQAAGLIVVSVIQENINPAVEGPGAGKTFKAKFKAKHGKITREDITLFCRQLSTLLGAGVTISMSLDIISKQVASRKLGFVLSDLQKNMEAGLSFHETLSRHPKVFSDLWINLVESGEASGNLAVVLSRLASYLERDAEFKRKIISALIYPGILTCAGLGALFFMAVKIIPTFAEIFKGFDIQLPLLTRALIFVSDYLRKYLLFLILIVGAGVFLFKKYVQTKKGRRVYEKIRFKLPVFGQFFLATNIEKFSSEMSTLLESGVPILYCLDIAERSVNNLTMGDVIRRIKDSVREGKPLREPLESCGFFEPMVVQMISIGEEIGELPQMFKKINQFYQELCETFLARFVSMFEPFILIFMGSIIGIMVVGMFLPIFQIAKIGGG